MQGIRRVRDGGELRMLTAESTLVLAVATAACYVDRAAIYRALSAEPVSRHHLVLGFGRADGPLAPLAGPRSGIRVAVLAGLLVSLPVLSYLVARFVFATTGPLDPMLLAVPVLCVLGAVGGLLAAHQLTTDTVSQTTYANRAMEMSVAFAAVLGSVGALILRRAG